MFLARFWSRLSFRSLFKSRARRQRRQKFLSLASSLPSLQANWATRFAMMPEATRSAARRLRMEPLEARALLAADLDLTKSFTFAPGGDVNGSGTFNPGDTILYTVTVTNSGDVDLTGVTFDDV